MAAILNSGHPGFIHFAQKKTSLIHSQSHLPWMVASHLAQKNLLHISLDSAILHKKSSLIHSDLTWWTQPSLILPCLNSDTAIFDSDTLLSSLRFTQKHSHSTLTLNQTNSICLKTHSFSLNLMKAWPSWILPCWIQPFCTKLKPNYFNLTQTLSFWLNLMIAAFFNLAILDSTILVLPLILTHTCQEWLPPFAQKTYSHFPPHHLHKKSSLIHSDSTWWWQASWILTCWIQRLPSWIQTPCYLLSDSLKNTLTPLWLWIKPIQSDSNSIILT